MSPPGLHIILGLARLEQLEQRLRGNIAISHKEAIDIERCMQEISAEDLQVRSFTTNNRDLGIPAAHVSDTIFHRKHSGLG